MSPASEKAATSASIPSTILRDWPLDGPNPVSTSVSSPASESSNSGTTASRPARAAAEATSTTSCSASPPDPPAPGRSSAPPAQPVSSSAAPHSTAVSDRSRRSQRVVVGFIAEVGPLASVAAAPTGTLVKAVQPSDGDDEEWQCQCELRA